MTESAIISKLPYSKPFLFVDEILNIEENGVIGCFTFNANLDFYKGHFVDNPVTPGVILIETMAQIGLVCLGIFLIGDDVQNSSFVMTSSQIDFLKPIFPNEKVTVISKKIYFRFGKLKCKVQMFNHEKMLVCEGFISGIALIK